MSRLISFDPAVHHVGWAAFDAGKLARCGLENGKPLGAALERRFRAGTGGWQGLRVIVEVPQVYQQRNWRGDPNDLIEVALVAGRVAQSFGADGPEAELIRPHAWKGNAPKEVMLKRIVNRLDDAEQAVLHTAKVPGSLRHNVIDAIGIGLWALGRIGT